LPERVDQEPEAETDQEHGAKRTRGQLSERALGPGRSRLRIERGGDREGPDETVDRPGTEMAEPGGGRHPARRVAARERVPHLRTVPSCLIRRQRYDELLLELDALPPAFAPDQGLDTDHHVLVESIRIVVRVAPSAPGRLGSWSRDANGVVHAIIRSEE